MNSKSTCLEDGKNVYNFLQIEVQRHLTFTSGWSNIVGTVALPYEATSEEGLSI